MRIGLLAVIVFGVGSLSVVWWKAQNSGTGISVKGTGAVEAAGAAQSPSQLTPDERKYLTWILVARLEALLPQVATHHYRTVAADCTDCFTYYYYWGTPRVMARIATQRGDIIAAVDTTGYDYLSKQQGVAVQFDELN